MAIDTYPKIKDPIYKQRGRLSRVLKATYYKQRATNQYILKKTRSQYVRMMRDIYRRNALPFNEKTSYIYQPI